MDSFTGSADTLYNNAMKELKLFINTELTGPSGVTKTFKRECPPPPERAAALTAGPRLCQPLFNFLLFCAQSSWVSRQRGTSVSCITSGNGRTTTQVHSGCVLSYTYTYLLMNVMISICMYLSLFLGRNQYVNVLISICRYMQVLLYSDADTAPVRRMASVPSAGQTTPNTPLLLGKHLSIRRGFRAFTWRLPICAALMPDSLDLMV